MADKQRPASWLPILECYIPITRRKSAHAVRDAGGKFLFGSLRLTDCVEWLHENGWSEYRLASDKGIFRVRVEKITNQEDL